MSTQSTPPLLLVHGWAGSTATWDPLRREVAAAGNAGTIIPVALPGSPGSTTQEAPDIAGATRTVLEVLGTLDEPAVLVGHSMGAQITLLAQAERPDRVHAEVVIDPAYGSTATREEMATWADEIERQGHDRLLTFFTEATESPLLDEERARILADLRATPLAAVVRYLRSEYVDPDAIGLLDGTSSAAARRQRPVLAVHTTQSGADTEARLPAPAGSRILRWVGHSHFVHMERPAELAREITRWAATLDEGDRPSVALSTP